MEQEKAILEMQGLEQNIQQLLFQKQAFQMELSETESALKEIESAGEEVFKIIGQLMIKSSKGKMRDELSGKKKILELRLKAIEKQEKQFTDRVEEIREEIMKSAKE